MFMTEVSYLLFSFSSPCSENAAEPRIERRHNVTTLSETIHQKHAFVTADYSRLSVAMFSSDTEPPRLRDGWKADHGRLRGFSGILLHSRKHKTTAAFCNITLKIINVYNCLLNKT